MEATLIIIGRLLLGGLFLVAGLRNWPNRAIHGGILEKAGVPQPLLVASLGIALQTIAGALLALGLWPSAAAVALIVFTVFATAIYHNILAFSGRERDEHINALLSNIALVGGLLLVIATAG